MTLALPTLEAWKKFPRTKNISQKNNINKIITIKLELQLVFRFIVHFVFGFFNKNASSRLSSRPCFSIKGVLMTAAGVPETAFGEGIAGDRA